MHGLLRRLRNEFEAEKVVKIGKQIEGGGLNFRPTIARSRCESCWLA